eukprot:539818-Amphidinium_carterae.1
MRTPWSLILCCNLRNIAVQVAATCELGWMSHNHHAPRRRVSHLWWQDCILRLCTERGPPKGGRAETTPQSK